MNTGRKKPEHTMAWFIRMHADFAKATMEKTGEFAPMVAFENTRSEIIYCEVRALDGPYEVKQALYRRIAEQVKARHGPLVRAIAVNDCWMSVQKKGQPVKYDRPRNDPDRIEAINLTAYGPTRKLLATWPYERVTTGDPQHDTIVFRRERPRPNRDFEGFADVIQEVLT